MKKSVLALALAATCGVAAQAQEKLDVKMTGRALFDAASYWQNNASEAQDGKLTDGVAVRDIRVGVKATYGKWLFRGDLSYTNNSVSLKDTYLQYSFQKNNFLRAGYYTVPFGLSSAYSSAKKEYMDEPEGNVYQVGRRIGVMHTIYNKPFWGQYGAFADNSALTKSTDKSGRQGYTLAARGVWRPIMTQDYGFHVGFSWNRVQAEATAKGKHAAIGYNKRYLTVVDKTVATGVTLTDARWENKFTAEFQGLYRNFQLSSQYYWSHIAREGGNSYNTDGFYVSARGIVVNPGNYKYNFAGSGVDNPDNKNLEVMLGYGYLNLRDGDAYAKNKAAIAAGLPSVDLSKAGRMSDVSVGLSYFLNKYVTFRLNYHFVTVKNFDLEKKNVNVLQARVQYIF